MRDQLQELYNRKDTNTIVFEAEVGFRRSGNVRFASKPSIQKLLLKITHNNELVTDHLVLTVGKEIPAVPLIYARILPGMKIKFMGQIFPYVRKSDSSSDYSIKLIKLLESSQINKAALKEAWLNGTISSKQYLEGIKRR